MVICWNMIETGLKTLVCTVPKPLLFLLHHNTPRLRPQISVPFQPYSLPKWSHPVHGLQHHMRRWFLNVYPDLPHEPQTCKANCLLTSPTGYLAGISNLRYAKNTWSPTPPRKPAHPFSHLSKYSPFPAIAEVKNLALTLYSHPLTLILHKPFILP